MAKEHREQLAAQIEHLLTQADASALAELLKGLRASDIAEVVELMENDQRHEIFKVLANPMRAEVLEKVDEAARAEIIEFFHISEFSDIISELDPDDAADVLAEMPRADSEEVLGNLSPDDAAQIKDLMSYSEDSAGGIMDPVLISVEADATVAEAVGKIRSSEIDEDFFSIFVVDKDDKYLGDVRIRLLLTSHADSQIGQLLSKDSIYVNVDADQEEVRNLFRKNDLIVAPVLDADSKLIGRITADRILEVAEEEANEDIYAMAGTDTAELEKESVFRAARIRMTWLTPCLIGTAVTALVGIFFRETFFEVGQLYIWAAAVVFAPMIAAISGNAGLQTSAIVVSGLAAGHLADLHLGEVFEREVRIALIVAIACAVLAAVVCVVLPEVLPIGTASQGVETVGSGGYFRIAIAQGVGMFSAIMVSTTLGLFLPFLFRRIGIDPAISAGPLVTTANDSISVLIYMTLTLLLVKGF
ncbi:MAG: magnesium transporter [Anaerohalosphaeraceae bacterium]|nr:magnesium transporter [Anaerohalosphaeraceae bacterium]